MLSFEEILDKMAFLYFEEPEEDEPEEGEFDFITKIGFKGEITGFLNVFFTRGIAEQIARNLVGIRDEDELFEGTTEDAVCEFTNMVMGRTLTILNPEKSFEMEVPSMLREPTNVSEDMLTLEIAGNLEDEPCKLLMHYWETPT